MLLSLDVPPRFRRPGHVHPRHGPLLRPSPFAGRGAWRAPLTGTGSGAAKVGDGAGQEARKEAPRQAGVIVQRRKFLRRRQRLRRQTASRHVGPAYGAPAPHHSAPFLTDQNGSDNAPARTAAAWLPRAARRSGDKIKKRGERPRFRRPGSRRSVAAGRERGSLALVALGATLGALGDAGR